MSAILPSHRSSVKKRCAYLNCWYKNTNKNVSMFRFPVNDPDRLAAWIRNVGNEKLKHMTKKQLKNRFVCISHFPQTSIRRGPIMNNIFGNAIPLPHDMICCDDDNVEDEVDPKVESPIKVYSAKRKVIGDSQQESVTQNLIRPPKLEEALIKQRRLDLIRDTADIDLPKVCKDKQCLPSPVSTLSSHIQHSKIVHYQDNVEDSSLESIDVLKLIQECAEVQDSTQECAEVQDSTQECADVQNSTQECPDVQDSTSECDYEQSDVNICRICLQSFSKLISIESYGLRTAYEQLTGVSVEHDDGLPRELCVECATLLDKYHKFRDKSIKGDQLLRQIYDKDGVAEKLPLEDIDQAISSLASSIDFSPEVTCIEIKPTKLNNTTNNNNPDNAEEHLDINPDNAEEHLDINPDNAEADLDMAVDDEDRLESEISMDEIPSPTEETNFELEIPFAIKQEELSDEETDPLNTYLQARTSYSRTVNEENKLLNAHFVIKKLNEAAQKTFHSQKQMDVDYFSSLYQCQSCYEGFQCLEELKEHGLYHSVERGKVVCDICKIRYSHKIELRAHTEEMHLYSFCCNTCHQLLHTRQFALEHLKNH